MGKFFEGKNTLSQEITKLKSIHSAYGIFMLKGSRLGIDFKRNLQRIAERSVRLTGGVTVGL